MADFRGAPPPSGAVSALGSAHDVWQRGRGCPVLVVPCGLLSTVAWAKHSMTQNGLRLMNATWASGLPRKKVCLGILLPRPCEEAEGTHGDCVPQIWDFVVN